MEIILLCAVSIILYGVFIYNSFVKQQNMCDEGWSGVLVQLKRRSDLIPNLIACVKGYASHEQTTLETVVNRRNQALSAENRADKITAEKGLSDALKSLFALAESYPDLKANQNYLQLQTSLVEIEDNLQNARRYYNATVRNFNTSVQSFPSNLIARHFGFEKKDFFDANESDQQNPTVQF